MNRLLRRLRDFLVSLKLTVVLLALGILLVFAATLDQTSLGIWGIQQKWFRSFFVVHQFGGIRIPVFPGGYLVGGLLFINLVAAHVYRFKLAWRKTGIFLTHLGLMLLLVGELLTGLWQQDSRMRLQQGETKSYSESYRLAELAITDTTDPQVDAVVAIPEAWLARGEPVQHARLPFRVLPKLYHPNSVLQERTAESAAPATAGLGPRFVATPRPITYKQDERNFPTAFVELVAPEGSLGTWLVSTALTAPQSFAYAGRTWKIALRPQRTYRPFSLTLLRFTHDVYAGTDIPKNFSSRIRLQNPGGPDDREVLIYMNNPLRYAGLTFYQASFEPGNDQVTILQVVRNPGWQLPYLACTLLALGLVVQFGQHLAGFIRQRAVATAVASSG